MDTTGIFQLLGSIITTAITAMSQQSINMQNTQNAQDINSAQLEQANNAARVANQRNIENYFNMHAPAAMVQQYKDAGLSPGLMYSMGGTSGQIAAPMAATPNLQIPSLQSLFKGIDTSFSNILKEGKETEEITQSIENLQQEIKESDAKIKKMAQETSNLKIENENMKLNNELLKLQKQFEIDTYNDRVKTVQETYNTIVNKNLEILEHIRGMKIENEKKDEFLQAQIDKMNQETQLLMKQQILVVAQTATETAKQLLMASETEVNYETKEKIRKELPKIEAETEKILQDTYKDAFTLAEYKLGHYNAVNAQNPISKAMGIVMDATHRIEGWANEIKNYKGVPYPTGTSLGSTPTPNR